MAWKNAPSVAAALAEATRRWPKRSKESDGTIGDAAHSARESDHNPDDKGIVHAFDLTHDPKNGADCERLAEHLRDVKDSRVKYIIWNRRICNSPDWTWKSYTGTNPHTKHMHVSILSTTTAENDTSDWWTATELEEVVEYIVGEMNRNIASSEVVRMRQKNASSLDECLAESRNTSFLQRMRAGAGCVGTAVVSKPSAAVEWASLVRPGGIWDHKPHIRKTFRPRCSRGEQCWHSHLEVEYFYDIHSNVHYGYVGSAAGFSESALLDGAGLAQLATYARQRRWPNLPSMVSAGPRGIDDPMDQAAIRIGISLYGDRPSGLMRHVVMERLIESQDLNKRALSSVIGPCVSS